MKKILFINLLVLVACSTHAQKDSVPKYLKNIQERFEQVYELETECDSMFAVQIMLKGRNSKEGISIKISNNHKIKVGIINDSLPSPVIVSLHKDFENNSIFKKELNPSPKNKKELSCEFSVDEPGHYKLKLRFKEMPKIYSHYVTFYVCYKKLN